MLGNNLKHLRLQKKLTQQQLADLLQMNRVTYTQYELNKREPDNATLLEFANFFKVTVDYLLNKGTTLLQSKDDKKPKDLQKILDQHEIMFSGTPLTEEDKQAILDVVELQLYKRAKELNKRKKSKEE